MLEKLLLIDNIDDLYEFFISQKSGYDKNDLVKHFVQIAKDNMVFEDNLETISGGIMNQIFSKSLSAFLSTLILFSLPSSINNASAYSDSLTKSPTNSSKFLDNIKDKIAQKAQQVQKTIKEYPITSAVATSALTFCGLYKGIMDKKFENEKEFLQEQLTNYLNNNASVQSRCDDIVAANDRALNELNTLRLNMRNLAIREDVNALITSVSDDLASRTNTLSEQCGRLSSDIRVLRHQVGELSAMAIRDEIQNINAQIRDILNSLAQHEEARVINYDNALALEIEPNCNLSSTNGMRYLANLTSITSVDINNTAEIIRQLNTLCNRFGVTRGVHIEDPETGLVSEPLVSPTQYFFTVVGRYRELDALHKETFAQCVNVMYSNLDDPRWSEVISASLVFLSTHGGHRERPAHGLVDTLFGALNRFLIEHNIQFDAPNGTATNTSFTDLVFSSLKDAMVQRGREMFLEDSRLAPTEPWATCNDLETCLRMKFGIIRRDDNFPRLLAITNCEYYLSCLMDKHYLIKESNRIIRDLYDAEPLGTYFDDVDQKDLSFVDYCTFSGKSHEEIQSLVRAVESYPEGNFKTILGRWIAGNISLNLNSAQNTVNGAFHRIVKIVPVDSLTQLEGEDNRYNYTDTDGRRHVCKVLRTIRNRRQIEYVDEYEQADHVQCNIISMLSTLGLRDRLDNTSIGCPELDAINGFKFIIKCFDNNYLQEIR